MESVRKNKARLLPVILVTEHQQFASETLRRVLSSATPVYDRVILVMPVGLSPSLQLETTINSGSLPVTILPFYVTSEKIGFLHKSLLVKAFELGYDYLVAFNEGAMECMGELEDLIAKESYQCQPLTIVYRKPKRHNVGRIYNILSAMLASLSTGRRIPDVKGDGVNIFKVRSFVDDRADRVFRLSDSWLYLWDLLQLLSYHREGISFAGSSLVETPTTIVRLNTKFFLQSLKNALAYSFRKKSRIISNKSSINPRSEIMEIAPLLGKGEGVESQQVDAQELIVPDASSTSNVKKLEPKKTAEPKEKYLQSLDHFNQEHKNIIVVNWCLTNICNYKCTYCPEDLHNGTRRGPELEDVENFFKKIKALHPEKKVFFEFTGGEVTYYKKFPELIRMIKDMGGYVGVLSNAGRKLDFWEKHVEFIDHICLSFHSEQGDPEHFYNVASYLCQRVTTHVNVMMKPENFDLCYKLSKKLVKDCEVSLAMQPLLENMDGEMFGYTDEQKRILDQQELAYGDKPKYKRRADHDDFIFRGNMLGTFSDGSTKVYSTPELISKRMNQWAGWDCHIGLENLIVDFDGNVARGWCKVGGNIGRVDDPDLKLPKAPITCVKKFCNCGQDIMATKTRKVKNKIRA